MEEDAEMSEQGQRLRDLVRMVREAQARRDRWPDDPYWEFLARAMELELDWRLGRRGGWPWS